MPVSAPSALTANKAATIKTRGQPRKTRIVRRRGRVNDSLGSDDEIERELGTDSESDQSSIDSATDDSDTEPASEDLVPNTHPRIITPPSTSPSPRGVSKIMNGNHPSFFQGATSSWSEMVADENENGPGELPVIDFHDFDSPMLASSSHLSKSHRSLKKPVTPPLTSVDIDDPLEADHDEEPVASSSTPPPTNDSYRRPPGRSAREAYQQRLNNDPSYVPTVGEFWGHDDRLLDKDLRSLSGWWRGRWQGRGRGRGGFGFSRGHGRGFPGSSTHEQQAESNDHEFEEPVQADVPPVEKPWTHDGFEEMKRRDDNRQQNHTRGNFGAFRGGRGSFTHNRGRGGLGRGAFVSSPPSRTRTNLHFNPPPGRVWFAMKPECMWTKQHEGFLYFDSSLKPRPGYGPIYRVRLPGECAQIVRTSTYPFKSQKTSPTPLSTGLEEIKFVVRLPKQTSKHTVTESPVTTTLASPKEEPVISVEDISHDDDAFVVRPELQVRTTIRQHPTPPSATLTATHSGPSSYHHSPVEITQVLSSVPTAPIPQEHAESSANQSTSVQQAPAVQDNSQQPVGLSSVNTQVSSDDRRPVPPALPPLQTSFSPHPHPSPYGSPYNYASAFPPGIAVNHHGMAYEVATGRPVYLQAAPQMYNPQPVMHTHMGPPGIPYMQGHVRHPSGLSPDFLAPSHTPPVNGFIDPSTGTPMFTLPRQNSRVEIRAPAEILTIKSLAKGDRRPSGLRTNAVAFEPSKSVSPVVSGLAGEPSYTLSNGDDGPPADDTHTAHQHIPEHMGFTPYQQYYYPEPYGYPGYLDMSQVGQYEMYHPTDAHVSQAPIYY